MRCLKYQSGGSRYWVFAETLQGEDFQDLVRLVWPFRQSSGTAVASERLPGVQLVVVLIQAELTNWLHGLPTAEIQCGSL